MNSSVYRGRFQTAMFLFLLFVARSVSAQGISSSGTEFWVGFMPNNPFTSINVTQLFIASLTSNTVMVTVNGVTQNITMQANSVTTVNLSGRGVTDVPEVLSTQSVHVVAQSPITMYGFSDSYAGSLTGGSPDGYLALPVPALGNEYYTVNYYDAYFLNQPMLGEFVVIAPEDNTIVTITTKSHTLDQFGSISHNPGDTWSVTLMKGESYLVQSSGQFFGVDDLTGSHVTSTKPIALLSGHQCAPIDFNMQSADHLIEMIPSVDKWGTQYFDMPMAGRTVCGDYLRVLSGEDGNQISANGGPSVLLNAGEWIELTTVTSQQVFSSLNKKKFIVAQYSYSEAFNGDPAPADPFLILMTPQEQFENQMLFRVPDPAVGSSFTNFLTILCLKDSIHTIQINGNPVTAFTVVDEQDFPGTNPLMTAMRINLPDGSNSYFASANTPFGMYQYGFSDYEAYGWPTGMALQRQLPDTLPPLGFSTSDLCGKFHLKIAEDREKPAFAFEDSRIADVELITQPNDARWSRPSFNYALSFDRNFQAGDSEAFVTITPVDMTKPGYAAIYVLDRAGNDTVYEFREDPSTFLSTIELNSMLSPDTIMNVQAGDTIEIPLYITTSPAQSLPITPGVATTSLNYQMNTDFISPFEFVSLQKEITADPLMSTKSSASVTLHFAPDFAFSGTTEIGKFLCVIYLTDTLESQVMFSGNAQSSGCATASIKSNTVHFILSQCGDSILSKFIATGAMPDFYLSPNPATNSITIRTSKNTPDAGIEIFDQLGRSVVSRQSLVFSREDGLARVDISSLASGMYYVRVKFNGFVRTKSLMIHK